MKKETIDYAKSKCEKIGISNIEECFFDTRDLAVFLDTGRTNASKIANALVSEKIFLKINTRPVLFSMKEKFEEYFSIILKDTYGSLAELESALKALTSEVILQKMIGYDMSLSDAVEQMKTAVFYPGRGLPMMITGDTGVGKSFFVNIAYQFMKSAKVVDDNAPFKVFNCAQYHNNPELLSGILFGYVKGAFTGAEEDRNGLLNDADGGVLFLDEVHRLPPEGQEKLFVYMDEGFYSRIGETSNHASNVRLVFATTEQKEDFLETFMRRIPIHIHIPNIEERGILEKKQIVEKAFFGESKSFNKNIVVSPRVFDLLLQSEYSGNIGDIKNVIKYVCGRANAREPQSDEIYIVLKDLPAKMYRHKPIAETYTIEKRKYFFTPKGNTTFVPRITNERASLDTKIMDAYTKAQSEGLTTFETRNLFESVLDNIMNELIYANHTDTNENLEKFVSETMQDVFRTLDSSSRLVYDGNFVTGVSYYIYKFVFKRNVEDKRITLAILNFVKDLYPNEQMTISKIIPLIETSLDIHFSEVDQMYLSLFLSMVNLNISTNEIEGIIVAHGYATASSIANLCNRILGKRTFIGIDMPIVATINDISEKIFEYSSRINSAREIIVMVDMGSLNTLYASLCEALNKPLLFIDQLNTLMALEVGNMIDQKLPLQEIGQRIKENVVPNVQLYEPKLKKEQAIITTCLTGLGTAIQIQTLLSNCLDGIVNIQILSINFAELKNNGIPSEIEKKYEIVSIVGTDDPEIKNVPFVFLDQIITGDGKNEMINLFDSILTENEIDEINNRLVRSFSLNRVLDSITILDTKKIMEICENVINSLEKDLLIGLTNAKKIAHYVHISCMVERLIRRSEIEEFPDIEKFSYENEKAIRVIKNVLSVIEQSYSVHVPLPEIGYIHNILYPDSI
ncbi:sigma 54-interacting transcriptional regulator [Carnobacterium sp.]|uniref:sigma 54-interacting transcriptional regulator n=1 Tax=Carnobacterium sp. TaxID=48221 RepID=UPI0028AEB56B|nr:sigma 54-interacting transcriptional regulator [Carnobacterium sp.]